MECRGGGASAVVKMDGPETSTGVLDEGKREIMTRIHIRTVHIDVVNAGRFIFPVRFYVTSNFLQNLFENVFC